MIGEAAILARVERPVRTSITDRFAAMLAAVAPVEIGLDRGYEGESPRIYLTPGRETVSVAYGVESRVFQYTASATLDARDSPYSMHEAVDRLIALMTIAVMTHDEILDSLIDAIAIRDSRPGYSEGQGALIGAEIQFEVVYTTSPTNPYTTA